MLSFCIRSIMEPEVEIAYLLVQIPMLIALRREGASYENYLESPLVAAPLMLFGALVLLSCRNPIISSSPSCGSRLDRCCSRAGLCRRRGLAKAHGIAGPAEAPTRRGRFERASTRWPARDRREHHARGRPDLRAR